MENYDLFLTQSKLDIFKIQNNTHITANANIYEIAPKAISIILLCRFYPYCSFPVLNLGGHQIPSGIARCLALNALRVMSGYSATIVGVIGTIGLAYYVTKKIVGFFHSY